jgi:hypothetical protein
MIRAMSAPMSQSHRPTTCLVPNHRQQLAVERLDFAVGELASTLLACCISRAVAEVAIRDVREAVGAAHADILATD